MNEEIDIIELLKRVKEGKAPKLIQIDKEIYHIKEENLDLRRIYETVDNSYYWDIADIYLDTKIKILDKPIIEELEKKTISDELITQTVFPNKEEFMNKINEIINWINNKGQTKFEEE